MVHFSPVKKYSIAAVVNFCTNESRFLAACLEQVSLFAEQVIVPVCDHFFDGNPENRPLLEEIYASFPNIQFIEYPYVPRRIPKRMWKGIEPVHFWHSFSRLIGARALKEEIEMVLFLDADEVPDGNRFIEWLECSCYTTHTVQKMANYWYFREPRYQAEQWEDSIVLAQRKSLAPQMLLKTEERDAIYESLPGPKRRMVVGLDGLPMFHHYSWVRTEEEMLKKVRSWGHQGDRDWEPLVKKEFSGPFQGVDFIHHYRYKTVDPLFSIDFTPPLFPAKGKPNVLRLNESEVVSAAKSGEKTLWKSFGALFSREKDLDF